MPKQTPAKIPDERSLRKIAEMLGDYMRRTEGKGRNTRRVAPRRVGTRIRNVTLTENMGATTTKQASFTFDDYTGGDTGHDFYNLWSNATSSMTGKVFWNAANTRWEFLDIHDCDAVT